MSDLTALKEKALKLPQLPGVYLMKDESNTVIYVGKAVKLRNRVSSYFRIDEKDLSKRVKTEAMILQVKDFDVLIVESEFEALLVENALIKELLPKYNIKLRDDKGYPVIRVDMSLDYPIFKIANNPANDGALYLGPYGSRTDTRRALEEIMRVFKLPACGKKIDRIIGKERPCLNFNIGNCPGYCTDAKLLTEHKKAVASVIDVLQGKTGALVKKLTAEMEEASARLEFEQAAALRDRIKSVKTLERKQFFKEDPVVFEEPLVKEKVLKTHLWLEKALHLDNHINRIEAFDISNTGSRDMVGSMVVFNRGKPLKSAYRRFKIKTKKKQDDYGSMAEVISRRISRYLKDDDKFKPLPDLILIDGGANHARAACKVLEELDVQLPVFGMVKDEKHRTRALVTPGGDEISLAANPAVFALIGSIQEEAHRFAVDYHRTLRSKSMLEGKSKENTDET